MGAAAAGVVPALVVRHVINANLVPRRSTGLGAAAVFYLGALAAEAIFTYVYSYRAAVVAQRIIVTIRVRLFSHFAALGVSYWDRTPLGEMISRATADVETIDLLFTDGLTTLIGQLFSLVAVAIAMIVISPRLSVMLLVVLPPLVGASRWIQLRVRDAERANRVAVGELNTQLSETVGGAETIRAFHRHRVFVERFRHALERTLVAQERSVRFNAFFTPTTSLLSAAAVGGLLWVGAGGVFATFSVNLGTLTAFVLLFRSFFAPIVALGDQWNAVQAALAGAERVFAVLDLKLDDSVRPNGPSAMTSGISVRDVSFAYPDRALALHHVNLTVEGGQRVAVVGRTGSGKSTLLALIAGLYEPHHGEIVLSGRSASRFTDAERRREIGVVPQRVQLFSGTLRDNVTLLDPSITDDAVRRALEVVGLDQWYATLDQGLDSPLSATGGETNSLLSAGQRQLIALARALVGEPRVLLLDEATSAIDAQSEAAFREALRRTAWSSHCAVLSVAHRLATARDADRIVVLEDGRVVEEGGPAELIKSGGYFSALVALDEAGWDWSEHH